MPQRGLIVLCVPIPHAATITICAVAHVIVVKVNAPGVDTTLSVSLSTACVT